MCDHYSHVIVHNNSHYFANVLSLFPGSGQVKLVLKTSLIYLLKALSLGSNGRQS